MTRRASTTTWSAVRKVEMAMAEMAMAVQAPGLACACRGLSSLVLVCVLLGVTPTSSLRPQATCGA